MKDTLITALETICPNDVYLQGTLSNDAPFPETFITFWTNYTDDISFYDDDVSSVEWDYSVILYSSDSNKIKTYPALIISALKTAGFIPQGKGSDAPSGKPSHTGWAMTFIYRENISNTNNTNQSN